MFNQEAFRVPPPPRDHCVAAVFKNTLCFFLSHCYNSDMHHHFYKKNGFTLAEVLITLGIIGVVAALTMPTLIANIQQEIFNSRWKKAYSEINQAYLLVQGQEDISDYWTCKEVYCFDKVAMNIFSQYIKINDIQQIYNSKDDEGNLVYHNEKIKYKNVFGDDVSIMLHKGIVVNDMTLYYWSYYGGSCSIWVDVNGYKKGPNVLGRDLFALEIKGDKIYPFGQFATGDWCKGASR